MHSSISFHFIQLKIKTKIYMEGKVILQGFKGQWKYHQLYHYTQAHVVAGGSQRE